MNYMNIVRYIINIGFNTLTSVCWSCITNDKYYMSELYISVISD